MSEQRKLAMSAITATLAWEFWNLARFRMLSALIGVATMNVLFYQLVSLVISPAPGLPESAQANLFVAVFFVDVVLIVIVLLRSRDADSPNGMALDTRAFLLPLRTWQLVLAKMFFMVVAAGVLWVAVSTVTLTVTSSALTGEIWPMLGPALVAAIFTAIGLAIFWLPLQPKLLKWAVAFVMLMGPMFWTGDRFTRNPVDQATQIWSSVAAAELATLVGFLLAAYGIAVFGTVQARRGATLGFSNLGEIADTLTHRWRRTVSGTFRSPATAQVWFEWRQKGWTVPLIVACLLVGAAILMGRHGEDSVLRALSVLLVGLLFYVPLMIGCLTGGLSQSSRDVSIDLFRASRPLSDTGLANAALKAGTLSFFATWAVAVVTSTAILGVVDLLGDGGQLERGWLMVKGIAEHVGWIDAALGLIAVLIVSWANMTLVASIFLTGRNKVVAALVVIPYTLGVGGFFTFLLVDEETIGSLFSVGAWTGSSTALVVTTVAFVVARRRRLIGGRLPSVALALCLAAGLVFAWRGADQISKIVDSGIALERAMLVLGPGMLVLAVAPLALAPLALAWNRHR